MTPPPDDLPMIIEPQARNARQLDAGIWLAELTPLEVQFVDPQDVTDSDVSVVLCSEPPEFDPERRTLRVLDIRCSSLA